METPVEGASLGPNLTLQAGPPPVCRGAVAVSLVMARGAGAMAWAHRYERLELVFDHQAGACAVLALEPIGRRLLQLCGFGEQLGARLTRRMLLVFEDDNESRRPLS